MLSKNISVFKSESSSFRGALLASGVMAFAGMGDALLYPVLPVFGEEMGFSVFWIGLLLSVNRFVRIIGNTPIANLVNQFGMKAVLVITSVVAVITTFFYGLELGLIPFFIARIFWGLSYSGLKIATLNYAVNVEKRSGLAIGLSKGIKSLGPLFILWAGPVIIRDFGINAGLFIVALISSVGIFMAISLPGQTVYKKAARVKTRATFSPTPINLLVFIMAVSIDGILVVALSNILSVQIGDIGQLLAVVAFYLLLRKLFTTGFSFISGILSLSIQPIRMFNFSVVLGIIGLLLIVAGFHIPGIVIAFLFNTVVVTFSPLIAVYQHKNSNNSLQAISGTSTWWDLGAALGAFMGIYLVEKLGPQNLFLILAVLISALFVNFIIKYAN